MEVCSRLSDHTYVAVCFCCCVLVSVHIAFIGRSRLAVSVIIRFYSFSCRYPVLPVFGPETFSFSFVRPIVFNGVFVLLRVNENFGFSLTNVFLFVFVNKNITILSSGEITVSWHHNLAF